MCWSAASKEESQLMAELYFLFSRVLWVTATVLWLLGLSSVRKRFNSLSKLLWKKRKQALLLRLEKTAAREAAVRERHAAMEARAKQNAAEKARRQEQQRPSLLRDPNQNTDEHSIHWARLHEHGYSRYRGETEFMGPRGGIYTVTASGNRNYR